MLAICHRITVSYGEKMDSKQYKVARFLRQQLLRIACCEIWHCMVWQRVMNSLKKPNAPLLRLEQRRCNKKFLTYVGEFLPTNTVSHRNRLHYLLHISLCNHRTQQNVLHNGRNRQCHITQSETEIRFTCHGALLYRLTQQRQSAQRTAYDSVWTLLKLLKQDACYVQTCISVLQLRQILFSV